MWGRGARERDYAQLCVGPWVHVLVYMPLEVRKGHQVFCLFL